MSRDALNATTHFCRYSWRDLDGDASLLGVAASATVLNLLLLLTMVLWRGLWWSAASRRRHLSTVDRVLYAFFGLAYAVYGLLVAMADGVPVGAALSWMAATVWGMFLLLFALVSARRWRTLLYAWSAMWTGASLCLFWSHYVCDKSKGPSGGVHLVLTGTLFVLSAWHTLHLPHVLQIRTAATYARVPSIPRGERANAQSPKERDDRVEIEMIRPGAAVAAVSEARFTIDDVDGAFEDKGA